MAVDRADVAEAQLLEERARDEHLLHAVFQRLGKARELLARRELLEDVGDVLAHALVDLPARDPEEVARHGADVRRDRHVVVVQDHEELALEVAGLVQALHRDAAREAAVAHDRDDFVLLAPEVPGDRHAERRGDRRRGVRRAEDVVLGFRAVREAREPARLADRLETVAPAGQDLVRIRLVAHVPDEEVLRRVEHVVERDGQLDRAEAGREVPARLGDGVDDERAELVREERQLLGRQRAQVARPVHLVEKGRGTGRGAHRRVLPARILPGGFRHRRLRAAPRDGQRPVRSREERREGGGEPSPPDVEKCTGSAKSTSVNDPAANGSKKNTPAPSARPRLAAL